MVAFEAFKPTPKEIINKPQAESFIGQQADQKIILTNPILQDEVALGGGGVVDANISGSISFLGEKGRMVTPDYTIISKDEATSAYTVTHNGEPLDPKQPD